MSKLQQAGYTKDDTLHCVCERCKAGGYYHLHEIDDNGYFECHECHAPNFR